MRQIIILFLVIVMGKSERYSRGRALRLQQEVNHVLNGVAVKYTCVYKRTEQAAQFKRGWDSVTTIDIDVAVHQQNRKDMIND